MELNNQLSDLDLGYILLNESISLKVFTDTNNSGTVTANMQLLMQSRLASFRMASFTAVCPFSALNARVVLFQQGSK